MGYVSKTFPYILNPFAPIRKLENPLTGQCPHYLEKSPKPPQPKDIIWKTDMILGNLEKEIRDAFGTKGFYKPVQWRPHLRTLCLPDLHL